ncbi:MAG: J domain-containing protein [Pirellulales bacterium]
MLQFLTNESWPSAFDAVLTIAFLLVVIGVPVLGYVFLALDIRAYFRSLRRGMAVIVSYLPFAEVPDWARSHTPRAIAALGLQLPCSETDLMRAYRRRVKTLHPDRGGDGRRFLRLQADFEEALALVRAATAAETTTWPQSHHAA